MHVLIIEMRAITFFSRHVYVNIREGKGKKYIGKTSAGDSLVAKIIRYATSVPDPDAYK
jgi:hypothetical protein